jgi:hypothetical protein
MPCHTAYGLLARHGVRVDAADEVPLPYAVIPRRAEHRALIGPPRHSRHPIGVSDQRPDRGLRNVTRQPLS